MVAIIQADTKPEWKITFEGREAAFVFGLGENGAKTGTADSLVGSWL